MYGPAAHLCKRTTPSLDWNNKMETGSSPTSTRHPFPASCSPIIRHHAQSSCTEPLLQQQVDLRGEIDVHSVSVLHVAFVIITPVEAPPTQIAHLLQAPLALPFMARQPRDVGVDLAAPLAGVSASRRRRTRGVCRCLAVCQWSVARDLGKDRHRVEATDNLRAPPALIPVAALSTTVGGSDVIFWNIGNNGESDSINTSTAHQRHCIYPFLAVSSGPVPVALAH